MSHCEKGCAEDVGNQGDACENGINQYEMRISGLSQQSCLIITGLGKQGSTGNGERCQG